MQTTRRKLSRFHRRRAGLPAAALALFAGAAASAAVSGGAQDGAAPPCGVASPCAAGRCGPELCAPGGMPGFVNVAAFAPSDGSADASAAIQALIDANPNRTLYFPDGTYLLERPICTPADPRLSVDLQLSNYAVLKAAPGWSDPEAMVRLGAIHPANDIRTPGSVYSLTGGIIDGSGVANGVAIESGRETRVRLVSMKRVRVGLHVKRGVNGNSADADISDVHIVGNRAPDSVGVILEASDNTLSNMRIADVKTGVEIWGGGNLLTNVHPLWTNPGDQYPDGVGFRDCGGHTSYNRCYADHFSVGWLFSERSFDAVLDHCIAYWYAPSPGRLHAAMRSEGPFRAQVTGMQVGFRGTEATNTVLEVAVPGGWGFIRDIRMDARLVNETRKAYLEYR